MTQFVTHDVKRFIVSKPSGFSFEPGQAVELSIDEDDWREQGRPFTPSNLRDDDVLEFTIKRYSDHDGVTRQLHRLQPGATLRMGDPFGTIIHKGPGVFIAGGAGITPFLAIMRTVAREHRLDEYSLAFSNKTPRDVICEKELRARFGDRCFLTCTDESAPGYGKRKIDRGFLEEWIRDYDQHFYVCGPPGFVDDIRGALGGLGASAESVVFES